MASVILVITVVLLFLYNAFKYMSYRPDNFPPGPPRIPLFGGYLFLLMLNPKYLQKGALILSKWYKSKVIGFYVGGFPTIVANDYEGVKEILYRQEFDGRPDIFAGRLRDPNFERKGPPRIPLFGGYLFLLMLNPKYLQKGALILSKWYKSKVIGFYVGAVPTIVANSYESVKEILYRQEFDGRPDIFIGRLRDPNFEKKGIFFNEGAVWKDQRRFILRYLRDFGFGRRFEELEYFINSELLDMIDLMKYGPKYPHEEQIMRPGQALCPNFMMTFTHNCFLKVLCGEKVPRSEQDYILHIGNSTMKFQRVGDDYGRMVSVMPWIRHIFPNWCGYKPLRDSNAEIYNYVKSLVDKQIETFDENHERNFIDMYIKEMKKEETLGTDTTFLYNQFIMGIVDFMFPPLTAIAVQISLLFQWFLIRPDILKKVQDEIDDVVGAGRLPTLDDRINMSYTEATVREIMRLETLVPSSIPHSAMVDTDFMEYSVPKYTIMIPGLYAFHSDKELWGDPDNFRPERFLDDNGRLSLKKDISLPFGAGKRLCAGETFARNLMFLMTGALCQNFNFVLGPGEKPPNMAKNLNGIIISPPDFWINFVAR